MSARAAWSLCGLTVALAAFAIGSLPFIAADSSSDAGTDVVAAVALSGLAALGALIVARGDAPRMGWLFIAFPLTLVANIAAERYGGWWAQQRPGLALGEAAAWLSQWLWVPGIFGTAVFLPLLFPTGRLVSRRWRPVAWLGCLGLAVAILSEMLSPRDLDVGGAHANPLGVEGADVLGPVGTAMLAPAFLAAIASLVVRLRRSRGVERQQLKWVVFAAAFLPVGMAIAVFDALVLGSEAGAGSTPVGDVGWTLSLFALVIGIPLTAVVAILRHRLYDIDVVINRALVYGALSALLAGAYLGGVLLFGLVVRPLTGSSNLAIAASTLAVAALVRPARARIQSVVDRRFYRRRYDATRTLASFGARVRDEVDLDALGRDLRGVVGEALQPAHVSLWLRRAER